MIEIYLLEQLDAFARLGTLSAAAEELHVTQPALSRSMRRIESELGVALFDRSKSKISLNQTGRLAAELARRVLDDDRDLQTRVVALDRSLRGVALGSCAPWPIMELGRIAQRKFMGMTVTMESVADDKALVDGILSRTYQLVVLHQPVSDSRIWCQRWADERLMVSFKKGHRLARASSIALADLAGESILAWGAPCFWNDAVRQNCTANILFQSDIDALEELVTRTDFPTFNSDRMLEAGYTEDDRVDVPLSDDCMHVTYYVACLDAEKSRYSTFLSALRSQVIWPDALG